MNIQLLKNQVLKGHLTCKEEILALLETTSTADLSNAAAEIRQHFCGKAFNFCTIINGKSGHCTENCAYCAQSTHFNTHVLEYPLLSEVEIVKSAVLNKNEGVHRFSIVTSGKRLSDDEVDAVCLAYRATAKACNICLCASHGLLSYKALLKLKAAGVTRYHNNLETSRGFFRKICTTHSYDEKIETLKNAKKAGLQVCSGGILGLGERVEDRIDMAFTLRDLGVSSVPVNILSPIAGTPLEHNTPLSYKTIIRTLAAFRFILPEAEIRLAGGRALLPDKGKRAVEAGVNAAISGNMLTTEGISTQADIQMVQALGFEVEIND